MDYLEYLKEVLYPLAEHTHDFLSSVRVIIKDDPRETRKNIDYLKQIHDEFNRYWELSKLVV